MARVVSRGQIYYADLQSDGTSKQSGMRPVIICSNDMANRFSPVITVVALTTKVKSKHKMPTHVYISGDGLRNSIALCEQPLTISKTDLREYVTTLPSSSMEEVSKGLKIQLAL